MAASSQIAHRDNYTFFPKEVFLTPMEAFLGANPLVKSFADLNKTNSVVFNQIGDEGNFIINEDGIEFTKTKTSAEIKALVRSGIGSLDDRTIERSLEVTINVNGSSHELDAIVDGGNPIVEVDTNVAFSKNNVEGAVLTASITSPATDSVDGPAIALVITAPPVGGVQATGTAVVVSGLVTSVTITNPGSGYLSAPSLLIEGDVTNIFLGTTTIGVAPSKVAAAGYVPKERLVKTKWVMTLTSSLGDEDEGDLYTICPKLVAVDKDNMNPRKGEKASTVLTLRGLVLLNPAELAAMQAYYAGVNETELIYHFNAADTLYSEA